MTGGIMINQYHPDPKELLQAIETDPSSFMDGRRNDDICNWFFAFRLCEIEKGVKTSAHRREVEETFRTMVSNLNEDQQASLKNWDIHPEDKLTMVLNAYFNMYTQSSIRNYWVDQGGYDMQYVPQKQSKLNNISKLFKNKKEKVS